MTDGPVSQPVSGTGQPVPETGQRFCRYLLPVTEMIGYSILLPTAGPKCELWYERRQRRRDRRPTNDLHTDSDVLEDHNTSMAGPQSVSMVSPTSENSS